MTSDPLAEVQRPNRHQPVEQRFWMRVSKGDGCWQWTGAKNGHGYGFFQAAKTYVLAHRWSYEHHVGPIPVGLFIDHLCRNRACVNPSHMEARRTHCRQGRNTFSPFVTGYHTHVADVVRAFLAPFMEAECGSPYCTADPESDCVVGRLRAHLGGANE